LPFVYSSVCQKNGLILPISVEGRYHSGGFPWHGPDNDQTSAFSRLPYRDPPLLVLKLIA
jgi:hypothetical protein